MEASLCVDFSASCGVWEPEPAPVSGSKCGKLLFVESVEVWYFERCPQYDHTPRDKDKLPLGMGPHCVHHVLEPLRPDQRDTRGKVRCLRYKERKELLLPATPGGHRSRGRCRYARVLSDDSSSSDSGEDDHPLSVTPHPQDSDGRDAAGLLEGWRELSAQCQVLSWLGGCSPQGDDADQAPCVHRQPGFSIAAGLLDEEVVSRHDADGPARVVEDDVDSQDVVVALMASSVSSSAKRWARRRKRTGSWSRGFVSVEYDGDDEEE